MNIKIQGITLFRNYGLKSTQDRLERQEKRDGQIAFWEKQKDNLKNMKSYSLEDISRKLDILHGYDEQIAAAKAEYNNSQMFHVLDEAMERAEKIAEEAEKYAPKTPEERLEDMIEEATGVDKDAGMLAEAMDELEEITEEMMEESVEELDEMSEMLEEVENADQTQAEVEAASRGSTGVLPEKYKRIDYRI
jgi:hypothetical protein